MLGTTGDSLFKSLNKAQCRAVSSEASTVAILAGPGSGKTHTLTSRVVWLVDHVGINPCDIIVATFTVKASNEMKSRIGQALGDGREKKIVLGTFHSIARRYLAAYGKHIGLNPKFGIADDSDSSGIIKRICKRLDAAIEPAVARAWISKRKAKGTADERSVKAKNGKSIESQALEQCFHEYQSQLERSNLLDYDDLLVRCVELLRKFPHCVSNVQAVLIDEYQDTNGVQYDLMRLFAQKNRRITIVGDPDQSIYGWRSAEVKNLHRMLRDYPGTDEISLEENYRSSSSILDLSLRVIQQDRERYKKVLLPVHDKGTRPVLRKLHNSVKEAAWIVSEIKRIRMLSGQMIDFNDVAILLRSAFLSRHVESALGREGIPYRMVGGFKFYDRVEIKTILDYLRVVHQPDNNDALARIINVPKRGIGDTTIKSLIEEAERSSTSMWKLLVSHCRGGRRLKSSVRKQTEQKISGELIRIIDGLRTRLRPTSGTPINLVELVESLLRDLQYETYLEESYGAEYESRWANVQELVNLTGEFMNQGQVEEETLPMLEDLQQLPDTDVLARFLANVSLASDKQTEDKDKEGKPFITVSTIHAAKGLEWPVVFIPAVYKGSIPHMRSDDNDEERRLLYVAMTRAKALLYLSCPSYSGNGGGEELQLSPFVESISGSSFLKKGPVLERSIMTGFARLLGRELPSDDTIYKGMPPMAAPEDNLFPVDPKQPQASYTIPATENGRFSAPDNPIPNKRQKTSHPLKTPRVDENTVEGWVAPYQTTMANAGTFTIPQGPSQVAFTTAGAHYATIAAVEAETTAKQQARGPPAKRPAANRPPAQRNLLGYGYGVAEHDKSKQTDDLPTPPISRPFRAPPPYARNQAHKLQTQRLPGPQLPPSHAYPKPPATIDPGLIAHKLGSAKMPTMPVTTSRDLTDSTSPKKQYACFSSSPPKPPSPSLEKENLEPAVPPEEQTRPATSFHATTVSGTMGAFRGGIRKPAPLGRSGIAPVGRLNKPYKLTVKRP